MCHRYITRDNTSVEKWPHRPHKRLDSQVSSIDVCPARSTILPLDEWELLGLSGTARNACAG